MEGERKLRFVLNGGGRASAKNNGPKILLTYLPIFRVLKIPQTSSEL
jgi:hypothetical protein